MFFKSQALAELGIGSQDRMKNFEDILQNLSANQKKMIREASEERAQILFNIKGMIEILRDNKPFEFIEMGYGDIEKLREKGLISAVRTKEEGHVLQGELYELSDTGKKVAELLLNP